MKKGYKIFLCTGLVLSIAILLSCGEGRKPGGGPETNIEEKYGWELGVQSYTFKNYTFSETLDKIDSCGLKYVQAFPRQKIGLNTGRTMNFDMSVDTMKMVKKMLDVKGIRMLAYGVVKAKGAEEWKKVFEFCRYMGVQTLVCEPENNDLDIVSSFCDTYGINAAIHNHPAPTPYWHPDSVLNAISGRSERMGACADIGHWVRSGLDPVACLQKLKGHIKDFHFKDISQIENKQQSEVIWGQGLCKIPAVMQEMKSQRYKGMISVEYEYNLSNSVQYTTTSVKYFRNELKRL